MPTETFFNLPKEKQERILAAANKEFSRVSLNEASIANVIKEAGISRGSFYQYFADKEDLFYFLFKKIKRDSHRYLIRSIEKENGNLFAGFRRYFEKMLPEIFGQEHEGFYRHLFMHMDYHVFKRMMPEMKNPEEISSQQKPQKKRHSEIMEVVDISLLKVNDKEDLETLIKLLMHVVFSTIAEGYRARQKDENYTIAQINMNFCKKIDWLEKGAEKGVIE